MKTRLVFLFALVLALQNFSFASTEGDLIRLGISLTNNTMTFKATSASSTLSVLKFLSVSSSPAASDAFKMQFYGETSTGASAEYGELQFITTDVTNASEDATFNISVITAGTLANELVLSGAALYPYTASGLDLGLTGTRFKDLYLSGSIYATGGVGSGGALSGTTLDISGNFHQTGGSTHTDLQDTTVTGTLLATGTITGQSTVTATGFTIGSAAIVEAELEQLDTVTAGTVAANKVIVVDGAKAVDALKAYGDVTAGSVTTTGTLTAASVTVGDAVLTEAELETIDTITAGVATASKALILDSAKAVDALKAYGAVTAGSLVTTGTSTLVAVNASGNIHQSGSTHTDLQDTTVTGTLLATGAITGQSTAEFTGAVTATGGVTFANGETLTNASDVAIITYNGAAATVGGFKLLSHSASPANNDALYIGFSAYTVGDVGLNEAVLARIIATETDGTSTSLNSTLTFTLQTDGSDLSTPNGELVLSGAALYPFADSGLDLGISGTNDFQNLYLSGNAVVGGSITRTSQVYTFTDMKVSNAGGTDWVITDDTNKATLAASQTSETLIVKITGLHVGDIITKMNLLGQVESDGSAVTIDADLRVITSVAADLTDASVGAIVRPTVAGDTALNSTATHGVTATLDHTITSNETFYVKVTGTTAASTDIALQGVQLTVTQN